MDRSLAFAAPAWLLALVSLPLLVWWRRWRRASVLIVPFAAAWQAGPVRITHWWTEGLMLVALGLLVLGLARPTFTQTQLTNVRLAHQIMLAVDLSPSMGASDVLRDGARVERWAAVRPGIETFIRTRKEDEVGLVIFAGKAFTVCGPTKSYDWLIEHLRRLNPGMIGDGTAIGDGIVLSTLALDRLSLDVPNPSSRQCVVLVTDGSNNAGLFSPEEAVDLAKRKSIPVYTIAIDAYSPEVITFYGGPDLKVKRTRETDVDEPLLWRIAAETGGRFYRAGGSLRLDTALTDVPLVERSRTFRRERIKVEMFHLCIIPALICLLAAAYSARSSVLGG